MKLHGIIHALGSILLAGAGVFMPLPAVQHGHALNFAARKSINATASANWAGYVAAGQNFTEVKGSWTIPNVQPSSGLGVDATWVGIGGITSSDLIQSGTEAVTQNGKVQYLAWTEILPAASQPLNLSVHPGDNISVDVSETGPGEWSMKVDDATTGHSASKNVQYASSHSSAEWIEEAPSDANGILPLDNFKNVGFDTALTMHNGKSQTAAAAGAQPVTLARDDGTILASPTAFSKSGDSFKVTRTAAKIIPGRTVFGGIESWTHGGHGIKKRQLWQ